MGQGGLSTIARGATGACGFSTSGQPPHTVRRSRMRLAIRPLTISSRTSASPRTQSSSARWDAPAGMVESAGEVERRRDPELVGVAELYGFDREPFPQRILAVQGGDRVERHLRDYR